MADLTHEIHALQESIEVLRPPLNDLRKLHEHGGRLDTLAAQLHLLASLRILAASCVKLGNLLHKEPVSG